MVVLKGGVNQMYLTISELNTINNAIYKMVIIDETTKEEKIVTLLDTTINAVRYNQFQITLVDDINNEDLLNGIIYLNEGFNTYKFITIDPLNNNNMNICEYGLIKVLKNINTTKEFAYTDSISEQVYISYTGNINKII